MHETKIRWFVLSVVFVALGCRGQDVVSRNDDEAVCRFLCGHNTGEHWEIYQITSREGLDEIDQWVERNRDLLEYPAERLAIRPTKEIYRKRGNEILYYPVLCTVPIDTAKPKAFVELKPHIPKESVEELKEIAQKHGVKMDATDGGEAAGEYSELERELQQLIEQWDKHRRSIDVMVSSDLKVDFDSEAYLGMVKLGRPVLPLIVEEMKRGHGLLFHVVMDITELTPRDLEKKLGVSWEGDITDLYLLWWETEGQEACQGDPDTQDAGKIAFKQLRSYRWIEEEWGW